jgi:hypothetical protein
VIIRNSFSILSKREFVVERQMQSPTGDRVAILDSANINDRSQQGCRDSELAVIARDDEQINVKLNGVTEDPVSANVHQLRKRLWKKLFGLMGSHNPATSLQGVLDKPAAKATWEAIQKVAMTESVKMGSQHKAAHKETYKVTKTAGLDGLNSYAVNIPAQLSSLRASSPNPYLPYQDYDVAEPKMIHVVNEDIVVFNTEKKKKNAMTALQELTGFWIDMPLDFGSHERDNWLKGTLGGHAVAALEHPQEEGPVLAQASGSSAKSEEEAV